MRFTDVVAQRRMVRAYRPKPVEREKVLRIVRTARKAPSAGFTQGQYFVVVTDAGTRRAIAELADEPEYLAKGLPAWMSVAPVHVVVCCRQADYHARYGQPDKLAGGQRIDWPVPYWWVDAGAAMMLLLLAAVDEGLGAGFFGAHRLPGLAGLLGLPEDVQPVGIVTLGHPAPGGPVGSPATRAWKPEEEVIRFERWDG